MRNNDAMLDMLAEADRQNSVTSLQERQVRALETIAYNLDKIMKMMSNETKSKKKGI